MVAEPGNGGGRELRGVAVRRLDVTGAAGEAGGAAGPPGPVSAGDEGLPPLLFVPGLGHGAWAFAEHWLGHAASRGFPAYAVTPRAGR